MEIKEFARELDGADYGDEISAGAEKIAKENGFVVVFGHSDDSMEFRGAIDDEMDCYNGGTAYLMHDGILEECNCKYYRQAKAQCKTIEAIWCKEDSEYTWQYETEIPHETFDIYFDGEKHCRGIVFNIKDLAANS